MGKDIENPSPRPAPMFKTPEFNRSEENPWGSNAYFSQQLQEKIARLEAELSEAEGGTQPQSQAPVATPDFELLAAEETDSPVPSPLTSAKSILSRSKSPTKKRPPVSFSGEMDSYDSPPSLSARRVSFADLEDPASSPLPFTEYLDNPLSGGLRNRFPSSDDPSKREPTSLDHAIDRVDLALKRAETPSIPVHGMNREDYANLSYEEHMGLIERTARVRLDVLIDDDVPDEMLLADSQGLDFQKCLSTRWGNGLQSVWSTIDPMQRTKSKFHRGASVMRPDGGWFTGANGEEEEAEEEPEEPPEWGSDVKWHEFPHCAEKIYISSFTLLMMGILTHLVSGTCYCLITEGPGTMDQCYYNYRQQLVGGVVEW